MRMITTASEFDKSVKLFDPFYSFSAVINGNEYEIVHSYFVMICDTRNIANNFTNALFLIAQQTGTPVLDLLGFIRGLNKLDMNNIIAYYLNSFKSKTALYGISVVPQISQQVARNILE